MGGWFHLGDGSAGPCPSFAASNVRVGFLGDGAHHQLFRRGTVQPEPLQGRTYYQFEDVFIHAGPLNRLFACLGCLPDVPAEPRQHDKETAHRCDVGHRDLDVRQLHQGTEEG